MIIHIKCNKKLDKKTVGGKAYHLNQMFRLGYQICDGYILTAAFFDTFCSFNAIAVTDADFSEKILKGRFPGVQRDSLNKVFTKLACGRGSVIVRSGSLEEDTARNSFAGIYESVGNISNCSDMLTAIKMVWASYYKGSVEDYVKTQHCSMPVIIQEMLQCDKAGIIFTRNPVTYEQEYVIEACLGNNDKILKDECEAERYVISRACPKLHTKGVLTKQEVKRLVQTAGKMEQELGFPCDIEWGMAGGVCYLFQARPIVFTTKEDIYFDTREEMDCILLDRYAKPASVCYLSLLDAWQSKVYLSLYHKKKGKAPGEFPLCFLYNRVYWNNRYQQKYFQDDGGASRYKRIKFYALAVTGYRKWYGRLGNYNKKISSYQEHLGCIFELEELINLLTEVIQNFCIYIGIDHFRFLGIAQILYHKIEHTDMLQTVGIRTNQSKTVQVNQELLGLAIIIRSQREAYQLFVENNENVILELLERDEKYHIVWSKLQDFLKEHGHRGIDCDDLYYPHWKENPQSVITLLKQFLKNFLDKELGQKNAVKKAGLGKQWLADLCGSYMCLREDQRYYFDKSWVLLREILLKIADCLLEDNILEERQDIFHLTIREIVDGAKYPGYFPDKQVILARKEYFRKAGEMLPPYILKDSVGVAVQKGSGASSYKVMGVSSGHAVGRIRFINGIGDLAAVKRGEIGVVRTFHPSWTPILKVVSGLIMNYGNILSHGCVVAREYNIPVVVFNGEAQGVLSEGDLVRIDAGRGRLHILQKADSNIE